MGTGVINEDIGIRQKEEARDTVDIRKGHGRQKKAIRKRQKEERKEIHKTEGRQGRDRRETGNRHTRQEDIGKRNRRLGRRKRH